MALTLSPHIKERGRPPPEGGVWVWVWVWQMLTIADEGGRGLWVWTLTNENSPFYHIKMASIERRYAPSNHNIIIPIRESIKKNHPPQGFCEIWENER